MNIYNAILKAADHIERNPHLYDFYRSNVPNCGTPGCMLGWIGHFMGIPKGANIYTAVGPRLNIGICIQSQMGWKGGTGKDPNERRPANDATIAAAVMRQFAQRFKPQHTGLPDIVREIFTNPRQTIGTDAIDQRFTV